MNAHRGLFEVPGPGPYLLSHSVGCLPRSARAALERVFLEPWAEQGSDAWPAWLAAVDGFRTALACLLGGSADEFCPQPSVSAGLASLLSGLPRDTGRDTILASAHSFPSVGFAMKGCERLGYRLALLPEGRHPSDPQTWLDAIDRRVAAVVPMHVHSNTGSVAPVGEIASRARAQGAVTIVDICQSAGVIDIDLATWGVDAAIGSCVKWLCGGPGAAFLWIRDALVGSVEPLAVGWFSHADPFEFDIRRFRYAADARRFWGGTPSIAPFAIAAEGLATIRGIGVETVAARNRVLKTCMAHAAAIQPDDHPRGGTLCLTCEDPDALSTTLGEYGVRFDRRGGTLRFSFHVWNDEREAELVGSLARKHRPRLVGAPANTGR